MNITSEYDLRLLADALEVSMGGRDPDGNFLFCQDPARRRRGEELRAELRTEYMAQKPKKGRPKFDPGDQIRDEVLFRHHMTDLSMSEIAVGLGLTSP